MNYRNWVGINTGDKDLIPIYLRLPDPPPEDKIAGYGLPPEDQYFRRENIPPKLKNVEKRAIENLQKKREGDATTKGNDHDRVTNYKIYVEFWRIIESDPLYYQDEIKFMQRVWWHRTYGYFFFNDGEITYIPPDYYDYLNFWTMEDVPEDGGHPEYRDDRDRLLFTFRHYLETTTETFANIDHETGLAIKEFGKYTMIDTGGRVFFGDLQAKTRRCGATQQGCHKIWKGTSTMIGGYGTIISMDADNAEKHYYKKLLPAWRNYPMWLKPAVSSNNAPKTLKLEVPSNVFTHKGLNGSIDYTESAGERKNDGDKLYYDLHDEEGKCFARGTGIKIFDGSVKNVEDVVIGDLVMGEDSKPRTVTEVHGGSGVLYKVIPNKGYPFIVNGKHTMVVYASDKINGCHTGDRFEFAAEDYDKFPERTKRGIVLRKVGIDYPEQKHRLSPYFLGLWLGDGSHNSANICNLDPEIIRYLEYYATIMGNNFSNIGKMNYLSVEASKRIYKIVNGEVSDEYNSIQEAIKHNNNRYYVQSRINKGRDGVMFVVEKKPTRIMDLLKEIGVFRNKHIPAMFLRNSRVNRLLLLAGIIDTDGSARAEPNRAYEIIQKREKLSYDIVELARSLGFYCSITPKLATMRRKDGLIYECPVFRIKIHGRNLDEIPCLIPRKKYSLVYRSTNKDPMKTGFTIEPCGEGKYFGFGLKEDPYFLLADYTIVHNSKVNVHERWNVNKLAHSLGGGTKIIGYSEHPSTVEEMDDGGMAFYALARQSNFYRRIPERGQTYSGLSRVFFAAWINMEGFIDRFGKSVINKPTERQIALSPHAKFARMRKGAKAVIMAERDTLLKDGSPQAMEQYRSIRRKQPIEYAECWMGTAGNLGFDIEKINQREAELRRMQLMHKLPTSRVNFEWEGEPFNSKVRMATDPDNGKFEITTPIADELRSLTTETMEWDALKGEMVWWKAPVNGSKFTCGADPIGFDNKTNSKLRDGGSRQSNGGIAVLWEYDPSVEESADMHDWQSRSFVCTYSYRPDSTLEYLEDTLKCCVYWGAMLYAERNKDNLWQYFIERGYGGYLKYDIDPRTGRRADKPGFYTGVENKNDLFGVLKDFISYRIHKEMFLSFLNELKEIKGPEQMTLYDRLTAHGASLLGSKSNYGRVMEKEQRGIVWDEEGYMPLRQY